MSAFDPKQEELNAVIAMIEDTEKEAVEVGRALRYASGIVARKLKQNIEEIDRRYEALVERKEELEDDLSTTKLTDEAVDDLLQFAEDAFLGIENADFETKRRTLEMLQVVVTIKDKRFYVNSIAGTWEGEIRKLPRSRGVSQPEKEEKEGVETDLHLPKQSLLGCRFLAGLR